jgi:hypothetical protein
MEEGQTMRTRICLLAMLSIAYCCLCRAAAPVDAALQKIVNDKASQVTDWEREARFEMVLMIAGIACGGLITVLQALGSNTACKVASGLLGVGAAVATGVISKAPVSYTAYEKAVLQGRDKVSALRERIAYLEGTTDPENQKALREDFIRIVNDFHQISLQLLGNEAASGASKAGLQWQPVPVVYAQNSVGKVPSWVTALPASATDVYFRGEAQSESIAEAKAKSLEDAVEQCAKYLVGQKSPVSLDEAIQYARHSSAVADAELTKGDGPKSFRYYTLLRLEKSLARPEALAALAGGGRAACSSMKVEDHVLAEFKVGGKIVYIYVKGQHPQAPKFGQFGRPSDLADLVVFTKADAWAAPGELFGGIRKPGAPPPSNMAISNKDFAALSEKGGTLENKLENGKSFTVIVDGANYTISVETHYVRHYANITVCPA